MPDTFVFEPNQSQMRLLASNADVCLYGGAAGSGKSLVAIVDLLGLNEPGPRARYQMPEYRGLIYRQRSGDLADLIDKSKRIYQLVDPGANFNNSDKTWTFSSGAKIYMRYFERFEQAETFLQGQELATIYAEEVGQFEDDSIFRYAISRLRSSTGIKCYMRATCNPSRYPWLRELFRIDDIGTDTCFNVDLKTPDGRILTRKFQFIRGRLTDNKYLGDDYMANLLLQSEADQKALLEGRWDAYDSVDGQVYEHELARMVKEHRLTRVPYDPGVPVHTFWDIGMQDLTVILFVQFVGKEVRVIDMLKGNNVGIGDGFVPKILRRKEDLGYIYAGHHLPHDASQRDKFGGVSLVDNVRKYLNDVHILPRIALDAGLQLTKQMFVNVYIDRELDLYSDLVRYRRQWIERMGIYSDEPVHDKHSHAADAFRYIAYYRPKSKVDISDMDCVVASNPFTFR
jgi:hypothetical protein